jgi:NADPH2:quinone reductase
LKAIGFTHVGGPEVLQTFCVPMPEPGEGEVRIRLRAATVNPTDVGLCAGLIPQSLIECPPPYVPGMDAAGVLDRIGPGVQTHLRVGDRVVAIVVPSGIRGAYAEYVVVPVASVVAAPARANDIEAATLPMNGLTARHALDLLDLAPGQRLAVTGAAGAVGGYAIQLAKAEGLVVIADAAPADDRLVRELGADQVVPRGDGMVAALRAVYPDGVEGLVDAALLDAKAIGAVQDGGRITTLRGFVGPSERGITYHPGTVRQYALEQARLRRLVEQAESGELTLRVAGTLPVDQAAEAHRRLAAGGMRGRLVLEF